MGEKHSEGGRHQSCTTLHVKDGDFRDAMGCFVKGSPTPRPSLSQPSQEVVKEMIQFSKDTLEKIDKARSEGLYHEVRIHFCRDGMGKRTERFSGKRGEMGWGGDGEATKQVVFLEDIPWFAL